MKSDRLLSILLLLQTRGLVPAAELAERLEVSVRTIYRDIEALSASGVPVYAERGRHGGIALLPGFRTDVTGLTADESRALFVLAAQGAHSALGLDEALGSALRKVMAALPEPHRPAAELTSRRILVDPARWMSGPAACRRPGRAATPPSSPTGGCGCATGTAATTEPRTYTLDPYGLVVKAGVWYLVADHRGAAAALPGRPGARRHPHRRPGAATRRPGAGGRLGGAAPSGRGPAGGRTRDRAGAGGPARPVPAHHRRAQLAAEPVPAGSGRTWSSRLPSVDGGPRAAGVRRERGGALAARGPRGAGPSAAAAVVELYGNRGPGPADVGARVPRPAGGGEGDRVAAGREVPSALS